MRIIKRYRNRRLYDMEEKEFILLADLEAMVRRNEQFKVIDSASGRDITIITLTSVIGENVNRWRDVADTRNLLRTVIKLGGQRSMSILKNTVLAGIGFASLTRKKAEELIDSLVKTGELSKSEKKKAVLELLAKAEAGAKDAGSKVTKVTKEIDKAMRKVSLTKLATKTDIERLNKKIDKLSRALSKLEKNLEE